MDLIEQKPGRTRRRVASSSRTRSGKAPSSNRTVVKAGSTHSRRSEKRHEAYTRETEGLALSKSKSSGSRGSSLKAEGRSSTAIKANRRVSSRSKSASAKSRSGLKMHTEVPRKTAKNTRLERVPSLKPLRRAEPKSKNAEAIQTVKTTLPAGTERKVRILPLGGMREIGKNMTLYEYGDDLIIVDIGTTFPDEETPGVDMIIPDFTYLRAHAQNIRGVFLTHGHEDHIGAIAWFMQEFGCPVYGTALTLKLVENKLNDREHGGKKGSASDPRLHIVEPGEKVRAGHFDVEFIHVNHSIADACALAISTPAGLIVHSGDFKVDFTPVHGDPIDLNRFAELGNEGVLALVMESTNVERPGMTPSEKMVGDSFSEFFDDAKGRIFVATFSSNVFRLQQIISAAEKVGRKVCLLGYSMLKVFEAADSLGYIDYQADTLIEAWDAERYPDDKIVFIITGTQGEPMSALSRMAFAEHRQVNIKAGDMVLLSSSAIPGNEKSIYKVINELFKRGAQVVYEKLADIHVSGHAYRGELSLLFNLIHPQYFIPAHGEYRHLYKNAEMAESQGLSPDHIFLLNNGDVLELSHEEGHIIDYVEESAGVLIDGSGIGDVDAIVLKERRMLADDGIVTCFIAVHGKRNELAAEPEIEALGFIYATDSQRVEDACRKRIRQFAGKVQKQNKNVGQSLRQNQLREEIRNELFQLTKRRPMVIISVIEV